MSDTTLEKGHGPGQRRPNSVGIVRHLPVREAQRGHAGEEVVAKVIVGSVCHLDRGLTTFTGQATLL